MPACPHCGIWLVKKAPRRGLREYLLSVLTVGPYRCQVCTHRFLAFLWWPGINTSREYNRISVRYPVLLSPALEEDRKSTRLNSSHGYISYAVFCLKKKKKN